MSHCASHHLRLNHKVRALLLSHGGDEIQCDRRASLERRDLRTLLEFHQTAAHRTCQTSGERQLTETRLNKASREPSPSQTLVGT